jgi:hypothetical protein
MLTNSISDTSILTLMEGLERALEEDDKNQLLRWNDQTEQLLHANPEEQIKVAFKDNMEEGRVAQGQKTSKMLALCLLHCLKDLSGETADCVQDQAKSVLDGWKRGSRAPSFSTAGLSEVLRACKNWVRFCLQVYQARHAGVNAPNLIQDFKSTSMLQVYFELLSRYRTGDDETAARNVAQLLFYATYNPVTGCDEDLEKAFAYLTDTLDFFGVILANLMRAQTAPLALALVRNIHNAICSYPNGAEKVNGTTLRVDATIEFHMAPWVDRAKATTTLKEIMRDIIVWALGSEPAFPGNEEDLRGELIVEILRTFYVLRMGTQLTSPATDERLSHVVISLLQLDLDQERCYECQTSVVPLLMDASPSFCDFLVHHDATSSLLKILEKQMSSVLEMNSIDHSAAAALTPVLVVLNRFCNDHTAFRRTTKDSIFPSDDEEYFQSLVAEEEKEGHAQAKNMSPLDAPAYSLRGKLVRLLTWPQGQIKRFAGELLWSLCDGNANEFIHRVGMGNALPILNLKGVISLPDEMTGSS